MNRINFSDPSVFERLEDQAIDGALDYDEFPPAEYKYFSKLARLGYNNRHKGWSAEVCEHKQNELRTQYHAECELYKKHLNEMKRQNELRIKHSQAVTAIYKASDMDEILDCALTALEAITDEPGLKARIEKNIERLNE